MAACAFARTTKFCRPCTIIRPRTPRSITKPPRVVAVTFVHSASGVKLPLAAIGEMIETVNEGRTPENRILFSVDGVHGFGVENFKVRDLGCDFYVFGCH